MESIEYLGLFAGFCTTVAFFPQVVRLWRRKCSKDLSLPMLCLMNLGIGSWLTYGLITGDLPIIIANTGTGTLSMIVLILAIVYRKHDH